MFRCCFPRPRGQKARTACPGNSAPRWGRSRRTLRGLWPFGCPKNKKVTPGGQNSHQAPHTLIPPVQPQVPAPCACVCHCVWKEGSCGRVHPEQGQVDGSVVWGTGHIHTPGQGWRGGTGLGGCEPLPRVDPESPAGVGHCPGAGLGTHGSVSDLAAGGPLGRRAVGMDRQGSDASRMLPICVFEAGYR